MMLELAGISDGYADLIGRYFRRPLFNSQTWDTKRQRPPHPETVVKACGHFADVMTQKIDGRNWKRKGLPGVQYVVGVEPQQRGVLHSHAVMQHPSVDLTMPAYAGLRADMQAYGDEQWGWCKLLVARSTDSVNRYVSKYVVKHGEVTISSRVESLDVYQVPLPLFDG